VLRSKLKPEISAAVFAANPPQILKPNVTATGVHLIQVEELIQPELGDSLKNKILTDLFTSWLKQQIIQTKIAIELESARNRLLEKVRGRLITCIASRVRRK
jgi:parvulin-like peptidyl-prolyl isomerase